MVADTLTVPAIAGVDTTGNNDIKQDLDFDNVGARCDSNSDGETAWELPGDVRDLMLDHVGGVHGTSPLTWGAPAYLGGTAVLYDAIRATSPDDSVGTASCVEADDGSDTEAFDTVTPPSGGIQALLVRAEHSCGPGPIGATTAGGARTAISCF